MEWQLDSGLAKKMLEDMSKELELSQQDYLANMPHASELIYCLTRSAYKRLSPLPLTQPETLLFTTGIGLEQVLLRPHRKQQKGETEGIYWSADWTDYIEGIGELKSTRISSKRPVDELPSTWTKQILTYMYVTGHREVSLAIMHLMGNYRPPFPELVVWHGTATDAEVKANWVWMQWRKQVFMDHMSREEMPRQFEFNEDWECENCAYLFMCQARQSIEDLRKERDDVPEG